MTVLWQQLARDGLQNRKGTAQRESNAGQRDEKSAVTHCHGKQATVVSVGRHGRIILHRERYPVGLLNALTSAAGRLEIYAACSRRSL